MTRPRNTPSPCYEVWQKGDGDPRRRENWRNATPLEVLNVMQGAFAKNLGTLARQFPDAPRSATSVWWTYLHRDDWRGIDLGMARIRRLDPPLGSEPRSSKQPQQR